MSNEEAYQTFRKGEVVSIPNLTNTEAYHLFRLGEWASVNIPATALDLSAYHLSERTLTNPHAGLAIYPLSERTLVDQLVGLITYFNRQRTMIPALFTKFQLSESFGQ